ncbi:NAD(P)H-dependent flavin oxidoreductase [Elusimicrobiota bacterium]
MSKLPDLKIGDLIINPPIIQGGMGVRISLANLASAVSNTGCVGTIASAIIGGVKSKLGTQSDTEASEYKSPDAQELFLQIRKAKALTMGILAVNIMVATVSYEEVVKVAVDEGVNLIISGAGLPLNLPKYVIGSKTKIAPIVSSGRTTDIICKTWIRKHNYVPDAIVVEGPLAGGHLGYSPDELEDKSKMPKLENLLAEVLAVTKKYEDIHNKKIPVIAAGGIYDGKDIAKFLKLGASGVQIATRFVCTHECDASDKFKQAFVDCKKEDITIIHSPVGMPGRALKNEFLEKSKRGEIKFKCAWRCVKPCIPSKSPYCIADALINAANGNFDGGFVFAGANAYRCNKIVSVKELVDELVSEAEANM